MIDYREGKYRTTDTHDDCPRCMGVGKVSMMDKGVIIGIPCQHYGYSILKAQAVVQDDEDILLKPSTRACLSKRQVVIQDVKRKVSQHNDNKRVMTEKGTGSKKEKR